MRPLRYSINVTLDGRGNSGRPITEADNAEQIKLLACLIAEVCNISLKDMTIIGPGVSHEQLEEAQANYLRPETLQRATARLVNFHCFCRTFVEGGGPVN